MFEPQNSLFDTYLEVSDSEFLSVKILNSNSETLNFQIPKSESQRFKFEISKFKTLNFEFSIMINSGKWKL